MTTRQSPPRPINPVPTSGQIQVRVRYCECDPMGVAHHAAYLPWLEMARTELLRETGVSYADLETAGVFLVVVKLDLSYRRPAFYDDLVEIRTSVIGGRFASRVKIRHEYEVFRADEAPGVASPGPDGSASAGDAEVAIARQRTSGELLVTGSSVLACVDRQGRPAALPDWLVAT